MNTPDEVSYRLALARGFLAEAEQDLTLERWRSCVDNAQLSVENAGKSVLGSFGVIPRTHDPAQQIAVLMNREKAPENVKTILEAMLPDLLTLGQNEHFLTDYGDESTYTLPWDLFSAKSAEDALAVAQRVYEQATQLVIALQAWREESE